MLHRTAAARRDEMCVDCSASQVQNGREHLLRLPLGRLAWSTTPNLPQSDDRRKGALSAAKGRFGTNISGLIWQIMHLTDIISTVYKIYPMEQQTQEPGAGLEGLRETRTFRPQAPINGRIHLKDTKGDQPVSTHSLTRAKGPLAAPRIATAPRQVLPCRFRTFRKSHPKGRHQRSTCSSPESWQ